MNTDPALLAHRTIAEVIQTGLQKHKKEVWRTEPINNHLDKAARHILTYKLILEGNSPPDGENHLKNALTRLAMALTQEVDRA